MVGAQMSEGTKRKLFAQHTLGSACALPRNGANGLNRSSSSAKTRPPRSNQACARTRQCCRASKEARHHQEHYTIMCARVTLLLPSFLSRHAPQRRRKMETRVFLPVMGFLQEKKGEQKQRCRHLEMSRNMKNNKALR